MYIDSVGPVLIGLRAMKSGGRTKGTAMTVIINKYVFKYFLPLLFNM